MPDQQPHGPDGASELAAFGEELRREREIRGISVKEIADATKISKRFLDAIERNDHKTLPAPVFTRGFVREYARYVGLSTEDIVNRYNHAVELDDRIEKPPQVQKYAQTPPRDITPRPQPKRGLPRASVDRNILVLFLILIALGAVAWWAVQYSRAQRDAPDIVAAARTPATGIVAPPPPPPAAAQDDSRLRLAVEVVDNSWVTLKADGETVVNAEMTAGERRTFEAQQNFEFRTIGNAAGLRLTLNGSALPPLGDEGTVIRNRVLDRELLGRLRESSESAVPRS